MATDQLNLIYSQLVPNSVPDLLQGQNRSPNSVPGVGATTSEFVNSLVTYTHNRSPVYNCNNTITGCIFNILFFFSTIKAYQHLTPPLNKNIQDTQLLYRNNDFFKENLDKLRAIDLEAADSEDESMRHYSKLSVENMIRHPVNVPSYKDGTLVCVLASITFFVQVNII